MAEDNDYFIPEQVEEQVARLRQPPAGQAGQDAPDERRLIEDLQRLYARERADQRSLEAVWSRLDSRNQAVSGRSRPLDPVGRESARTRRAVSLVSVVAAALVIIVVVTAIVVSRAQPNTGTGQQGVSSPTPVLTETAYHPTPNDGLNAIQMLSPTEGWAVGGTYVSPSSNQVLILHYHNGQWLRVPAPSDAQLGVPTAGLDSISMLSADEGWAVGNGSGNGVSTAFILHYSGGRWIRYGGLLRDTSLLQVQMLSPTDGWASGGGGFTGGIYFNSATASVMLHYDGTRWTPAQTPNVLSIRSLDMLSATDGWATGQDRILHYDGQQWTSFQDVPSVNVLTMDSPSDGWAIGVPLFGAPGEAFWHYNGKQWTQGSIFNADSATTSAGVQAISMDSPTDGWGVGLESVDNLNPSTPTTISTTTFFAHYSQGRWAAAPGPKVNGLLFAVTMLSANEGWAVGGGEGIIMHYHNGTWSQYHS